MLPSVACPPRPNSHPQPPLRRHACTRSPIVVEGLSVTHQVDHGLVRLGHQAHPLDLWPRNLPAHPPSGGDARADKSVQSNRRNVGCAATSCLPSTRRQCRRAHLKVRGPIYLLLSPVEQCQPSGVLNVTERWNLCRQALGKVPSRQSTSWSLTSAWMWLSGYVFLLIFVFSCKTPPAVPDQRGLI